MNFKNTWALPAACLLMVILAACTSGEKITEDENKPMTKAQITLSLHPGADTANGVHYTDEAPSFRYEVKGGPGLLPEHSRLVFTITRGNGTKRVYPPLTILKDGGSGELSYQWDDTNSVGNYTITAKLLGDEDKELADPVTLKFRRVVRGG